MGWINDIKNVSPVSKYSQYGEEAYLQYIFDNIGLTNSLLVDIGAHDGTYLSNTKTFLEKGWKGLLIDGSHQNEVVKKHFVTRENVLSLLDKYGVPEEFDLLSLDIDGNDYHILDRVLSAHRPRVIISEFNSELPVDWSVTIKYDPNFRFEANIYYGYTYLAGVKLAEKHGYTIIHQNSNLNLYYLRNDLVTEKPEVHIEQFKWWGGTTQKKWIQV